MNSAKIIRNTLIMSEPVINKKAKMILKINGLIQDFLSAFS